jgi:peptidyl-dipeptidase Dcp
MFDFNNPLINPPSLPEGVPPLDLVKTEHLLPALRFGMEAEKKKIEAIKNNPEEPDFANTLEAMESAGAELSLIRSVFGAICSANTNDEVRAIEETCEMELSQHASAIMLDAALFARIKSVYDKRDSLPLDADQKLFLDDTYKAFVRSGALLNPAEKERFRAIDESLAQLTTKFSQNEVKATNSYKKLVKSEDDLAGVPERAKKIYRAAAEENGFPDAYLILLEPYPLDIFTHAENRALREEIYRAASGLCCGGEYDNRAIVMEIARLRHERARLLGFATHADFVLAERMAGDTQTVSDFLERNLATYKPAAEKELAAIKALALDKDGIADLKPWDVGFYARLLKERAFDLDLETLRPYFELQNVLNGLRDHAEKLFGIELREEKTGKYPILHPDMKVYEVFDKASRRLMGIFYADYFARPGAKRGGAWMSDFRLRSQLDGRDRIPLICNSCNFAKPTPEQPALLSLDDVRTVYHEFGHALHGLLSETRYPSQSGPNVKWDFVELPSQLQENWILEPEVLNAFARHYKTGEILPLEIVAKIKKMEIFGAGRFGLSQTHHALLDMAFHAADPGAIPSVEALEKSIDARASLLPREEGLLSTIFGHIFAGAYSAGYYSYKWAEGLEADVFERFKEKGLYDPATSSRLRGTIYGKGASVNEMDLFIALMGRKPDPDAMFRREGLEPVKK